MIYLLSQKEYNALAQADRCTTPHYACDCRERLFQEAVEALRAYMAKFGNCGPVYDKARAVLDKLKD